MLNLSVLIVDDEPLAHEIVVDYLEQQAELLSLTAEQRVLRRRFEELEGQVVELQNQLNQVNQTGQLSQLNFVPSEQQT